MRIARNEGLQGFYKGMHSKMLQTVSAAALQLMIKEELYNTTKMLVKS